MMKFKTAYFLGLSLFAVSLPWVSTAIAGPQCEPLLQANLTPAGVKDGQTVLRHFDLDSRGKPLLLFPHAPESLKKDFYFVKREVKYTTDLQEGNTIRPLKINGKQMFKIGVGTSGIKLKGGHEGDSSVDVSVSPNFQKVRAVLTIPLGHK